MTIWSSGKTLVTDMAWCILVGNITSASPSFNFGQTCLPLTRVGKTVLSLALANQCVSRYIPRNQRLPRDLLRFILVTSRNDSRKHRYILYVNYVAPTRFSWSASSEQIRFSRKICCTISTLYTVYLPLTSPPLVFAKTYPTNQKIRTQKGRYKRVRVKPPSLHLWQHHFDATPPLPRASSTAWNSRQMVFTWWKPLGCFFQLDWVGKSYQKQWPVRWNTIQRSCRLGLPLIISQKHVVISESLPIVNNYQLAKIASNKHIYILW